MAKLARELAQLSVRIDARRAAELRQLIDPADVLAGEHGVLLATAYPAWTSWIRRDRAGLSALVREGLRAPRDAATLRRLLGEELSIAPSIEAGLRRFAQRERARVALRELLPRRLGGADVDVTARELSLLADITVHAATEHAVAKTTERFGSPRRPDGRPSRMVVLGMGKLGGLELNVGSDVDLIYLYDTDDAEFEGGEGAATAAEFYQRVCKRLTALLEDVTDDGFVWRVDLRLRPEGGAGPIAISVAAAERYYESFGRLWERAALLRARPIAGDLELGAAFLQALGPFVWRRRIDPMIAREMVSLVQRSRIELSPDPDRDLKLGPGGIREAEFFVQTLQLVWGGREPALRAARTADALNRLEAHGYCTDREAREVAQAYLAQRRAEHAIQHASGIQTHSLPQGKDLQRIARALGYASEQRLIEDLARHRRRTHAHFLALLPEDAGQETPHLALLAALEAGNEEAVHAALAARFADEELAYDAGELAAFTAHVVGLASHPDAPLGVRARERFPGLAEMLLDAMFASADPLQAAKNLRFFFARVRQPAVYVRLAFADAAALRRLVSALGASAFVGNALCNHPELGDLILFSRSPITLGAIRQALSSTLAREPPPNEDPDEFLLGALRAEKTRATLEVALADLAGSFDLADVNEALSELAFGSLDVACRAALGVRDPSEEPPPGLAIIAMGKLGGREISYGSDLDVLFVFDPKFAPDPLDATQHFTRVARKVIRLLSTFHGAGPAYELDARLRPSGNQGLLVTSLDAFARYHGLADKSPKAEIWERMALTRARFAAGDERLGSAFLELAARAAFGAPPTPEEAMFVRHIRDRAHSEASEERAGRYDIKLGRGGLLDIEFAVQLRLLSHPPARDPDRVLELDLGVTLRAISALRASGGFSEREAAQLEAAYDFLRKLELRLRIVRADGAHVLEESGRHLETLARRMGERAGPRRSGAEELLLRYRTVTAEVRELLEQVLSRLGAPGAPSAEPGDLAS